MKSPPPTPWFGTDRKEPRFYKGLRMGTDTNLHEQLAAMIAGLVPPDAADGSRATVLDLGCGEGALSQRLADHGYAVTAVDRNSEHFKADGPAFVAADFNRPDDLDRLVAEHTGQYDLVLAVEVIEHLRSPWDFLAACRGLCRTDTHLVLTTPNVASWWGRLWFFLTGELWGFNPESWNDPGHVHAMTETEMRCLLAESGFQCLEVTPGGTLPILWAYNAKRLLASLLMLPLRPLMRGTKHGWVLCYHAKPNAEA